ncbi:hypothetical protein FQR65_LT01351 [Abscondita terminalis]|nr:hypothetical protein FQR65_LT01351 [Abscondita terminalis]
MDISRDRCVQSIDGDLPMKSTTTSFVVNLVDQEVYPAAKGVLSLENAHLPPTIKPENDDTKRLADQEVYPSEPYGDGSAITGERLQMQFYNRKQSSNKLVKNFLITKANLTQITQLDLSNSQPREVISIDLMGSKPNNKNERWIFVATDLFSRWVETFPMKSTTTPFVINHVDQEVYPAALYGDGSAITGVLPSTTHNHTR